MRELWTRDGAEYLARKLVKFWRDKGYSIHAWTVPAKGGSQFDNRPRYDVRSDLVNGWPPQKTRFVNLLAA